LKAPHWIIRCWITLFLTVLTSWFLLDSFYLSKTATSIPQLIISGTLLLLIIQLVIDLGLIWQAVPVERGVDKLPSDPNPQRPDRPRQPRQFLFSIFWITLLASLVWLLGLSIASFLFCLIFLRWSAGESWTMSIIYSVVLALLVSSVFFFLSSITPYRGVLAGVLT